MLNIPENEQKGCRSLHKINKIEIIARLEEKLKACHQEAGIFTFNEEPSSLITSTLSFFSIYSPRV